MRKRVSVVALTAVAVGITGCTAPGRAREPAGAAEPVGAAVAGGRAAASGEVSSLAAAAHLPAIPVGTGAALVRGAAPGQNADEVTADVWALLTAGLAPTRATAPQGTAAAAAPPAAPSGTTDLLPQPTGRPTPKHPAHPQGAAPQTALPPPALPAPAPPPGDNAAATVQSAATTQLLNAIVASHTDGKAVLLAFSGASCDGCAALDRALHTPKARAVLAQSYHLVRIDPATAGSDPLGLASQYGTLGGGPLLVVLAPDGSVRADSARDGAPKFDEAGLAAWLKQWAPR